MTTRLTQKRSSDDNGFTLIELLIVIAIILILIAIALPNFLEAQVRARVTKAKGELRSIGIALDSYFLDWDVYPEESEANVNGTGEGLGLLKLVSPIKYIAAIPEDPFGQFDTERQSESSFILYESGGMEVGILQASSYRNCSECLITWGMWSKGPDRAQRIDGEDTHFAQRTHNYAPTNGTDSRGSIYYWGGDPYYIGVGLKQLDPVRAKNPLYISPNYIDDIPYVHRLPPF